MLQQTRIIAYYTLLEAVRNRLLWLALLVLLVGLGIASFLGALAITESISIQATVLAAFYRLMTVFILAVFLITSMVREFNDKGLELVLSLALPRTTYLLGKFLGFSAAALVLCLMFSLALLPFSPATQVAIWGLSLALELLIVTALGLLCVLTFNQVMAALSAVFAFYLLARSVTALQLIGHNPLIDAKPSQKVINAVIDGIATLLPRLDEFTRSEWLAYHTASWAALPPLAAQSLVFLLLLGGAALFDFYRKNL